MAFGLTGPALAVSRGADAFAEAQEIAADWIATGRADRMVVVSANAPGPCAAVAMAQLGWSVDPWPRAQLWAAAVENSDGAKSLSHDNGVG